MKKLLLLVLLVLTIQFTFSQNTPPTTTSEVVTSFSEVTTNITLNAVDQDGDNLTYTLITSPTNGTSTLTDGVLTYTSNSGFTGYEFNLLDINNQMETVNQQSVYLDNRITKSEKLNLYDIKMFFC